MAINGEYATHAPERAEVAKLPGATLLEFGSPGCGHWRAAQIRRSGTEHTARG